ncbi:thymidine phosphorylase family protein [Kangiella koreensis]|uniref:Putative thymidine phosphorylase n=1 Tax=Kangiella koreensis (strain DSM 16069 / JCM 12317 / KCTC 12182 / SW-125) TaxID=523791 RepID=C7RBT4_KANKD|nr:thymidine phosphorylase family protein [Kangiella koreensis]ACV26726.1 thymidine phosphorylase [Kangiella koreensis DSM 16069]
MIRQVNKGSHNQLKVVDIGINTHQEPVIYMREDCHICRSEGFTSSSRITVSSSTLSIVASLNVVDNHVLEQGYVGLSKVAMQRLKPDLNEMVTVGHADVVSSLTALRKKVFGNTLNYTELQAIITDISEHLYSDIEISSFLTVCAGGRLLPDEIIDLTKAMVNAGKSLRWPKYDQVLDKHCIGGIPGNRTTPLVVSIVSAAGHIMPKTSSRAITSPAGTADTMETLTEVNLDLSAIQRVVQETGACLCWGGAVNLSPADDLLIRIERALDLDGEGQLIASVLSKKIAAGSTHTIIDIPVGDTAKVRNRESAERLANLFTKVGAACGIHVRCIITDGSKPIGSGIGPVEEARDLLAIFKRQQDASQELRERALLLASHLLDLAENCGLASGLERATSILESGKAYEQFKRILSAQGGGKSLPSSRFQHVQPSSKSGTIVAIDNRKLARLAKLAGAPFTPVSGLRLHSNVGDSVTSQTPLFTLFSDSQGELEYAMSYYNDNTDIFSISGRLQ